MTNAITTHLSTDVGDAMAQRVNRASDSLHRQIDNLATPVHGVVDGAATGAHHTVDKVARTLNRGASTVGQQLQRVVDAPIELIDATCGVIQKHPLRAVAISLAVGLLVGRLSARR